MGLCLLVAGLCLCQSVSAESAAWIVVGMTGQSADRDELTGYAREVQSAFAHRGLASTNIHLLSESVTRDGILAALGDAAKLDHSDDFWLVLLGHSGRTQGNQAAFQVPGRRLTADDLRAALEKVPARKWIFIGTDRGGAFLPALKMPDCTALSATEEQGEVDSPRFTGNWVRLFAEHPRASFAESAARASEATAADYERLQVLQAEHALLLDTNGVVLRAPFGATTNPPAPPAPPPRPPGAYRGRQLSSAVN